LLAGLVLSFYVYNHAQARTAPTSNLAATATANSTGEAGEAFPEAAGPQFLELQPTTSPLPSNTATLAAYLRLLNDRDSLVRQSAINGLGKLGSRQAIPPLLGLLSDPAKAVRDSASKALLALGAKEQTISAWVGLLSDRNEEIRQGAAAGLREMGDLQTISTLNPILTNPDPAVRQVAGEVRTYLKIKLLALNVALGSHD
jgi:HEAT repeat protein